MSITLALMFAAGVGQSLQITERAKDFVGTVLSNDATKPPPNASTKIKYFAWRDTAPIGEPLNVPVSLAVFQEKLRGCAIDQVLFEDDNGPKGADKVYVSFLCPADAKPTSNEPYLLLSVSDGRFAEANLYMGSPLPITSGPDKS